MKINQRGRLKFDFPHRADDALESCEDAVLDADVRSDLFRAASGDSSQSSMTSPKVGPGAPPHILLQDWLRANAMMVLCASSLHSRFSEGMLA